MSADLEGEHFAHPSEPGAHGHQQWLREHPELTEVLRGDPWALAGDRFTSCESAPEPTLNDELAEEAQRVALLGVASLARRGTRHDPEL